MTLHLRAIYTPSEARRVIMADLELSRIKSQETKEDRKFKRSIEFRRTGETVE